MDNVVNLCHTCKEYYNELHYLIDKSNSILINTFKLYQNIELDVCIKDSYYTYSNLKYYFNTHSMPLPKTLDDITYSKIKNTEIIYSHFFYEHNNKSDEILCKFYHNLFKMKYKNFKINDYNNYANNFFELKKDIDLYNNKYKYLVYNYSLSNYKVLDTPIFCDIDGYTSTIVTYRYNYIISHFDIYILNIYLYIGNYNGIIEVLNNNKFNYDTRISLKYLYDKIQYLINTDSYYIDGNIYYKLLLLYIYINYSNEIYIRLNNFNKNKREHYKLLFEDIIIMVNDYFTYKISSKDNYYYYFYKNYIKFLWKEIINYTNNFNLI